MDDRSHIAPTAMWTGEGTAWLGPKVTTLTLEMLDRATATIPTELDTLERLLTRITTMVREFIQYLGISNHTKTLQRHLEVEVLTLRVTRLILAVRTAR
jgi:hypothetical protein